MFNKIKPYLCLGSLAQQKAIDKHNENNQESGAVRDIRNEYPESDETYLPLVKVCVNIVSVVQIGVYNIIPGFQTDIPFLGNPAEFVVQLIKPYVNFHRIQTNIKLDLR